MYWEFTRSPAPIPSVSRTRRDGRTGSTADLGRSVGGPRDAG